MEGVDAACAHGPAAGGRRPGGPRCGISDHRASIARQLEFLQRVWVNDGAFVGLGTKKDPGNRSAGG
jgi:hypothetical protein